MGPLAAAFLGGILYRVRGGVPGAPFGTQLARLTWSLPAGVIIGHLAGAGVWGEMAIAVAFMLGLICFGHGAHMVIFGPVSRAKLSQIGDTETEILTEGWLPALFGGSPNVEWSDLKFEAYHTIGMAAIGLMRMVIVGAAVELFTTGLFADPFHHAFAFAWLTGPTQGLIYWLGWRLGGGTVIAEFIVGAWVLSAAVLIWGGV